ncbi:MAG: hypothetical protein Tsb0021_10320 [Chlamydiales bacterium]
MKRHFLLHPGQWIGEGKIIFSELTNHLRFFTRWDVKEEENLITAKQDVEISGGFDHIHNNFRITEISDDHFQVVMSNDMVSDIHGQGLFDEKQIAWEFRNQVTFEGFEVYRIQENGDYLFHAEYISPDQVRSIIEGRIWEKSYKSD